MKYLKQLSISILLTLFLILGLTFFITTLNYFDFISLKTLSVLKIIIPLLSIFIGGFYMGRKANKRGFLEGIKFSLIFILIFIITSFILNEAINSKDIIFYLIVLITSVFGSMFGINTKKEE